MDPLSAMGSLSLGGTATSHTQSMQGFPTSLSSAFSNPQSPAKAFPPLSNPNPSTPFGGIGSLSSQLPGMDSGTMLFLFVCLFNYKTMTNIIIITQTMQLITGFLFVSMCFLSPPGPLGSGLGSGIGSSLGMPAVSTDPFSTRKMSTPGLNPPTFQQSKIKACKWWW